MIFFTEEEEFKISRDCVKMTTLQRYQYCQYLVSLRDVRTPVIPGVNYWVPQASQHFHYTEYNIEPYTSYDFFFALKAMTGKKFTDDSISKEKEKIDMTMFDKDYYMKTSLARTRRVFTRLLLHNYGENTKLLTLTYAKAQHSLPDAWKDMEKMQVRWRKMFANSLSYLAVPELHPGGHGWHFHLVLNTPWFDWEVFREDIWKLGRIKVSTRPAETSSLGAIALASYLVKYLNKSWKFIPQGKKRYSRAGDWATDWVTKSGVVHDAKLMQDAMIAALQEMGVKFRTQVFSPYDFQQVYRVSCDLDKDQANKIKELIASQGLPRSDGLLHQKGVESSMSCAEAFPDL